MAKAIQYIGNKPRREDTVANTGLAWEPGEVHVVHDTAAAIKLLSYRDVWKEVPMPEGTKIEEIPPLKAEKPREVEEPFVGIVLESLDINALRDLAVSKFNHQFPTTYNKAAMISKLTELAKMGEILGSNINLNTQG